MEKDTTRPIPTGRKALLHRQKTSTTLVDTRASSTAIRKLLKEVERKSLPNSSTTPSPSLWSK